MGLIEWIFNINSKKDTEDALRHVNMMLSAENHQLRNQIKYIYGQKRYAEEVIDRFVSPEMQPIAKSFLDEKRSTKV